MGVPCTLLAYAPLNQTTGALMAGTVSQLLNANLSPATGNMYTSLAGTANPGTNSVTIDADGNFFAYVDPIGSAGDGTYVIRIAGQADVVVQVTVAWKRVRSAVNRVFDVTDNGAIGAGPVDESAAFAATYNKCVAAGGGIIGVPPGNYGASARLLNITDTRVSVVPLGPAGSVTFTPLSGFSGDVITVGTSPFTIARAGKIGPFKIDGSQLSGTNTVRGLHYGDAIGGEVDLVIANFTGPNMIGASLDCNLGFVERARIHLDVDNCTKDVVFTSSNGATSARSFIYNHITLKLGIYAQPPGSPAQTALTFSNWADVDRPTHFGITVNTTAVAGPNTVAPVLVDINTHAYVRGLLNWNAEETSGSGSVALKMDSTATLIGAGVLNFVGTAGMVTAINSAATFQFSGFISVTGITPTGSHTIIDPVGANANSLVLARPVVDATHAEFVQSLRSTGSGQLLFFSFDGTTSKSYLLLDHASNQVQVFGDLNTEKHLILSAGTGPAVPTAGAALGTSPPAIGISGSDTAFSVNMGTGTATTNGPACTVTFASPFGTSPRVFIEPWGDLAAACQPYKYSVSTTQLVIGFHVAPPASLAAGSLFFDVLIVG